MKYTIGLVYMLLSCIYCKGPVLFISCSNINFCVYITKELALQDQEDLVVFEDYMHFFMNRIF